MTREVEEMVTTIFVAALVAAVVSLAVQYVRDEIRDRRAWHAEVRRRMGAQR